MTRERGKWEEREPDLRGVIGEVGRLIRRSRKRWWLVGLIVTSLLLLVALREIRRQRSYDSEVVLAATEAESAELASAHTNARLQDYIWYAVFTDKALTETMEKFAIRPELLKKNPRLALDSFREDVDVDVYKNEFSQPRYAGSPPRSARIGIRMSYSDPEVALQLTRHLGDLVILRDAETRRERFEMAQALASSTVSYAETDLGRLMRELGLLEAMYLLETPSGRAQLSVSLKNTQRAIVAAEARLKEARAERRKIQQESSADLQSLSLRYERVEWGAAKTRIKFEVSLLRALLGAFLLLLPVVMLGVGAFDSRLYDERDVARMGLRPLGLLRKASMKVGRT